MEPSGVRISTSRSIMYASTRIRNREAVEAKRMLPMRSPTIPGRRSRHWPACGVRALTQHVARVGLGDQQIGVGLEQQARGDEARGGGAHGRDVAGVIAVALLERGPRVAGGRAVGLR